MNPFYLKVILDAQTSFIVHSFNKYLFCAPSTHKAKTS